MVKGGTHLVTGFRDFILRGNVVSGLIFTISSCCTVPWGRGLHRTPSVKMRINPT